MHRPKHVSASSITKAVDCLAQWAASYDSDRKVHSRSQYTDAGNLVHAALEKWRNPEANLPQTYETLHQCYLDITRELKLTETFGVFKRGLELLKKAYGLSQYHPTIPVHLATTISVETEIADYQPEGWPLPLKGFIDRLAIVCVDPAQPMVVDALVVEDYKTGKAKSWSELTDEDIQPVLYFMWVKDVLVPHLEALDYTVKKIALVWTYINDGVAVPMYEADFDAETAKWWVASISQQMLDFVDAYNAWQAEGKDINAFLVQYEKPNKYCSYCPRKNVCQSFQRLLTQELVIDLTSPNTSWDEINAARQKYGAMAKEADLRRKEIDDLIRVHLDQTKDESIIVGDMELVANTQERKEHLVRHVADILGSDVVINAASITQDAVNKELARIALTDAERANALREELEARMSRGPGARIVRERKIRKATAKK